MSWVERKPRMNREFKIKNFILKSIISKENTDRYKSAELVNDYLQDCKNMRLIFFIYVLVCYFYPAIIFCIIHYLFFDKKFLKFAVDFASDPFFETPLFPKILKCEIGLINVNKKESCLLDCYLKFNNLYENIYILILLIIFWLNIIITICLIELIAISFSKTLRFRRLQRLVPKGVENEVLQTIANDAQTFFFLESIYYRLDSSDFQKLIINLTKYYLVSSKKFCVIKCPTVN